MKKNLRKDAKTIWNDEYADPQYFSMSEMQSSELSKFVRWLKKDSGNEIFEYINALDVGCGNGRNLLYLADNYGSTGAGCDISDVAVSGAKKVVQRKRLKDVYFFTHDISNPFPLKDETFDLVMDMMVSHCLNTKQRETFLAEVLRLLKPEGWYLIKTFMKEGDMHAKRLIEKNPAPGEPDSYIHPRLGVMEHVWTEDGLKKFLDPHFTIHKTIRSHGYQKWNGQPYKRRYIVLYAQKKNT